MFHIRCHTLGAKMCLSFSSYCSLLELNSKLWKCCSSGQVRFQTLPVISLLRKVTDDHTEVEIQLQETESKRDGNRGFAWEKREEKFFLLCGMPTTGDRETGTVGLLVVVEELRIQDLKTELGLGSDLRCVLGKEEPR